jgi:hypothetical protein
MVKSGQVDLSTGQNGKVEGGPPSDVLDTAILPELRG